MCSTCLNPISPLHFQNPIPDSVTIFASLIFFFFDQTKIYCKWRMLMMVSVLENEHPADKYWYRSKPQNRRDVKNETPKTQSQKSLKNDYLQLLELQGTSERKLSFCPVITWNRSGLCTSEWLLVNTTYYLLHIWYRTQKYSNPSPNVISHKVIYFLV